MDKLKIYTNKINSSDFEVYWTRKQRVDAPAGKILVTVPPELPDESSILVAEVEAIRFLIDQKDIFGHEPTGWGMVISTGSEELVESMTKRSSWGIEGHYMTYLCAKYFHSKFEWDASQKELMQREIESEVSLIVTDPSPVIVDNPKLGSIDISMNAVGRYSHHFEYGDFCKAPFKSIAKALKADDIESVDIYGSWHFKKIFKTLEEQKLKFDLVVHRPTSNDYYVLTAPNGKGIRRCITMFFIRSKKSRDKWKQTT